MQNARNHSQDSRHLQDRGDHLEKRGESPGPIALDLNRAQGDTGSQNGTEEVGRVEEGCENSALLGVGKLSDEGGTTDDGKEDADTEDHTCDDVHGNCTGQPVSQARLWKGGDGTMHKGHIPC